jgi:GNAT superfamily N-acetyltransferase
MKSPVILPAAESDLPALAELAGVIWRQYYPGIISQEQIEYMLQQMYSLDTLGGELRRQGVRFYRLLFEERLIGFASIGPTQVPATMKLHKLYLLPDFHGRGLGGKLLNHCEQEAVRLGASKLILSVNKGNHRAITAYKRNGFAMERSVVTEIGGGFVMDDFIMAKSLAPVQPF